MSRFSPCRSLTLEGVCAECACECAMRFHHLMNPGSACIESYVTGQVVLDSGIENQISTWGGGPNGNEIPYYLDYFGVSYFEQLLWPSDDSVGPSDTYWVQIEQISLVS